MKRTLPISLLAIVASTIAVRAEDWPARLHHIRGGGTVVS